MSQRPILLALLSLALLFTACADADSGGVEDLSIERSTGYAVIVEERIDGISIGFASDRDAASGTEYDLTESVWRVEEGPWLEPPVTCVAKGQRIELGISQVENQTRPGLLKDRVVWIACLAPESE